MATPRSGMLHCLLFLGVAVTAITSPPAGAEAPGLVQYQRAERVLDQQLRG